MGLEKNTRHPQFGLSELGVLDGPPMRGARTIVQMVPEVLSVPNAALIVFDDNSGSLFLRVSTLDQVPSAGIPMEGSLSTKVRGRNAALAVNSTRQEAPHCPELLRLGAGAFIGAPVYGPDRVAIGVLAAFQSEPREWAKHASKWMTDLSHLVSQEIMLRASFETLRILSTEHSRILR